MTLKRFILFQEFTGNTTKFSSNFVCTQSYVILIQFPQLSYMGCHNLFPFPRRNIILSIKVLVPFFLLEIVIQSSHPVLSKTCLLYKLELLGNTFSNPSTQLTVTSKQTFHISYPTAAHTFVLCLPLCKALVILADFSKSKQENYIACWYFLFF